jgi:hypothetical protein
VGERRDRIRSVANYLGAASGIPNITSIGYSIKAPFPYVLLPITHRNLLRWSEAANDLLHMQMLVWYRGIHDSPADALVTMRASTAAELMGAHYNAGEARRKGGE